jgi:hypothetical protein
LVLAAVHLILGLQAAAWGGLVTNCKRPASRFFRPLGCYFSAQLRVAILLLVIGVMPMGSRDAGELTADATQLPTVFQGTDLF